MGEYLHKAWSGSSLVCRGKSLVSDPKVDALIAKLVSLDIKEVLVACGSLLKTLEVRKLILLQEKGFSEENEVLDNCMLEVYKILNAALPQISADLFVNTDERERDAYLRILKFLKQREKDDLLVEIAKRCTDYEIAANAAWYFIKKNDVKRIKEINEGCVLPSIKVITNPQ